MTNGYEDMLSLPHHRSATRAWMTRLGRAAQFAPFSALNGYEDEIAETGRLTDTAAELMEGQAEQIDRGLRYIQDRLCQQPEITVTYFVPDERKSGGAYRSMTGHVRKIKEQEQQLLLGDGTVIPFHAILHLEVMETVKTAGESEDLLHR